MRLRRRAGIILGEEVPREQLPLRRHVAFRRSYRYNLFSLKDLVEKLLLKRLPEYRGLSAVSASSRHLRRTGPDAAGLKGEIVLTDANWLLDEAGRVCPSTAWNLDEEERNAGTSAASIRTLSGVWTAPGKI